MAEEWTADEALPGAENWTTLDDLINQIKTRVSRISDALANRWAHAYGTRVWNMLKERNAIEQLGQHFSMICLSVKSDICVNMNGLTQQKIYFGADLN